MSAFGITGSYENTTDHTMTICIDAATIFTRRVLPKMCGTCLVWFQWDGATANKNPMSMLYVPKR